MKLFGERFPIETLGIPLEFAHPVPWEVFASEGCRRIFAALAIEAPETVGRVVFITSTWRRATPTSKFTYHHRAEAVDWRTGVLEPMDREPGAIVAASEGERNAIASAWARRVGERLGSEYDVIYGDKRHIDHGHAERDGRKVARVYLER